MKRIRYLIIGTIVISLFSISCLFYFPESMASGINEGITLSNSPVHSVNTNEPSIVGESAVTLNLSNNEVIYSKDPNAKRYPASLTKLMTAYLFAKYKKPTDIVPYTESAEEQPAFSLGKNFGPVYVGETMVAKDVMDALLLYSANDTAYMIADYVGGSKEGFVKLMNNEAEKWGLKGTHFMNPNGLNNPNHYTTAYDIAIIGEHAYSEPWVRETMNTKYATIKFNQNNRLINIENRNANLDENGNVAGKTGYTFEAGRCLFNIDVRNGQTIVGVVMKSTESETNPQVFYDMDKIMNYSFNAKPVIYENAGSIVAVESLPYKIFGFFGPTVNVKVPFKLDNDIMYYNNGENNKFSNIEINKSNETAWEAIDNGSSINFNELKYEKNYKTTALLSRGKLIEISLVAYLGLLMTVVSIILIVLSIMALIMYRNYKIKKIKKKRKRK